MTQGMRLGAMLLVCAASAHAQLYKWVGPDGKITYSDVSPPSVATRVETRSIQAGGPNVVDLPFEVAEAAKGHPVTLYSTRNCIPCDDGRKLLTERGIPFSEKTVNTADDMAQLRQVGGDGQLPMLTVGRVREHGFASNAWHAALTAAGYPETSRLPKTYRHPPAEAATPAPKAAMKQDGAQSTEKTASTPSATELPPAIGNAPPGFRF